MHRGEEIELAFKMRALINIKENAPGKGQRVPVAQNTVLIFCLGIDDKIIAAMRNACRVFMRGDSPLHDRAVFTVVCRPDRLRLFFPFVLAVVNIVMIDGQAECAAFRVRHAAEMSVSKRQRLFQGAVRIPIDHFQGHKPP